MVHDASETSGKTRDLRSSVRSLSPWALLFAIVVAALAIGAHTASNGHHTAQERARSIDTQIRCPSCEALSVAQSNASTAVAIRRVVLARVKRHESAARIERYLTTRYGTWILLRPPTTGITALVWFIPLGALLLLASVTVIFFRRRARAPLLTSVAAAPELPAKGEPNAVRTKEKRDLAPHAEADPSAAPQRRRLAMWLGVIAVSATALSVLAATSGSRLPGQSITGSLSLSATQRTNRQLQQARILVADGRDLAALKLYALILRVQPRNPAALAESGWLEYQAGAQAHNQHLMHTGAIRVKDAVGLNPQMDEPHLLLAYVLIRSGNAPGAATQLREFLADHPPAQLVSTERNTILEVFRAAGETPPASLTSGQSHP